MNARKQIILTITELDQKFQQQQIKANQYKCHLQQLIQENKFIIITGLLTAFILGFRVARANHALTRFWQFTQLLVAVTLTSVKNKLWLALIDQGTSSVLRYFLHKNQTKSP
ncbi:hypothetical protein [Legionella oakridgensis]|uniref:Transmembrane protein n=2 Tax=Legionella oakridgensis TaxID=29423 RepID=W0B6V3_9GAMM|nr:hypothetical protein [Legionella oakridgensis]AHE65600.1 hypothetical protein Loa_00009 [Legionella oakridgensis ATCC 33761 = DSM 21215]ETO94540.1 hypothetical protein LOR_10c01060 [Legionella oakridgensis RV-2-2007]KTD38305.1 hypothetical protein Loak_1981 [Legionella oakridgensis]STY15563.1 Uncharacterised protein [Legionella longbeachae]